MERLIIKPNLPKIEGSNYCDFINDVNDILLSPGGLKEIFDKEFDYYLNKKYIKKYRDINTFKKSHNLEIIGLVDLNLKDYFTLEDFGYEVIIPYKSDILITEIPPRNNWNYYEKYLRSLSNNGELFNIRKPWYIEIEDFREKILKTQRNIQIIFSLSIDSSNILIDLNDQNKCKHEFRLFYKGNWSWRLIWECINCGLLCYCDCFKNAIASKDFYNYSTKSELRSIKKEKGINFNNHPFYKQIDLNNLPFLKKACEVCRGEPSSHKYCNEMYARSEFEIRYGAYVKKEEIKLKSEGNISSDDDIEKIANNIVREKLGFKKIGERFNTETELYRITNSIFSKFKVIHHYRSEWLRGQELDIFIPDLNLAIEYQGEQHYKVINFFGGDDALIRNQKRDQLKKEKCNKNDIKLIMFSYKEKHRLSKKYVKKRLAQYIDY